MRIVATPVFTHWVWKSALAPPKLLCTDRGTFRGDRGCLLLPAQTGTMTEVAAAALAGLSVAEATPQTAANHGMPPGRVRHVFKTLDTDGDGTLSIEELKTGFAKEFKVDALAPHVRAAKARTNPSSGPHRKRPVVLLPPSCTFCTLPSVQTLCLLHLSRRRRSWPAWMRCSACTPTRRMEQRRPCAR